MLKYLIVFLKKKVRSNNKKPTWYSAVLIIGHTN